uniref:Uncharacterized protein n=1 Tax=Arundo donax TaxID=35708 RepID=A0A0A9B3M3_ARUDO
MQQEIPKNYHKQHEMAPLDWGRLFSISPLFCSQ